MKPRNQGFYHRNDPRSGFNILTQVGKRAACEKCLQHFIPISIACIKNCFEGCYYLEKLGKAFTGFL